MKHLLLVCLMISALQAQSQTHKRGQMYFYWGWNRAAYQQSDIHFTGEGYDFTLFDVAARDRQTPFHLDPYFKASRITIPQTNMRFGYMLSDKYSLSIGDDHMKYVMRQYQEVLMSGYIKGESDFNGVYDETPVVLTPQFLTFEHTDGLNYINLELRRHDVHFEYWENRIRLSTIVGVGAGVLFPKTNAKLMSKPRHDEFHVAGWGTSLVTGVSATFFNYFFAQMELKGGFISMPDIRTSPDPTDKASQHFMFTQGNVVFGVAFPIAK